MASGLDPLNLSDRHKQAAGSRDGFDPPLANNGPAIHPSEETPRTKGIGGHLQTCEPWVAKGCICPALRRNWAVARSTPHSATYEAFAPESLTSSERGARA